MAGKNVEGQLELFSLFDSVEELEQKIKGAGLKEVQGEPVMEQCYRHRDTGETAVAAYLDYNRVYVADWGRKPLLYQFDSTKEAVGYYADWLDRQKHRSFPGDWKYRPQREMMLPRSRSRRSTEQSGRLMSAMRLTAVTTAEKNSV